MLPFLLLIVIDLAVLLFHKETHYWRVILWLCATVTAYFCVIKAWYMLPGLSAVPLRLLIVTVSCLSVVGFLKAIRDARPAAKRRTINFRRFKGPSGRWVDQGAFAVDLLENPLGTGGLATCAGLSAINAKKNTHYLAHVDRSVTPEQLKMSLLNFDLPSSRFFVREGSLFSPVAPMILSTLYEMGVQPASITILRHRRFLEWLKASQVRGIISHRGWFYSDSRHDVDWNTGRKARLFARLKPIYIKSSE